MLEAVLSGKRQSTRGVNTLLLLQADKGFVDQSKQDRVIGKNGTCTVDSARSKFNGVSFNCLAGAIQLGAGDKTDMVFAATDPYTIEFWCYNTSLANVWWLYSGLPTQSDLKIYSGSVYLQDQASGLSAPASAMTTGKWTHVAVSSNGVTTRLFVDGAIIGTPFASKGWGASNLLMRFGGGEVVSYAYLDQIRVSKLARYTAVFTPPTVPFVVD